MDNLKYLKSISFQFHLHNDAIALLISASDFPAATAFSINESEIAELDPKFIRSSVKGIPNFEAISLTLSWEALASASAVDFYATAAFGTGFGARGAATGAATGLGVTTADYCLCLAKTFAIIDETLAEPAVDATEV